MIPSHAWLVDERTAWIVLTAWFVGVLIYGLARSSGEAKPDPIRQSGPFGVSR